MLLTFDRHHGDNRDHDGSIEVVLHQSSTILYKLHGREPEKPVWYTHKWYTHTYTHCVYIYFCICCEVRFWTNFGGFESEGLRGW